MWPTVFRAGDELTIGLVACDCFAKAVHARLFWYRNLYSGDMKTTLDLDDQLLADAKALAAQQRTSLTRLIEEGLQLRLRTKAGDVMRVRRQLPVFKGCGGLVAGVNASSNKAMLAVLDDDA
jgi:hypothetical protein